VGAIGRAAPQDELEGLVEGAGTALLAQTGGAPPHRAILGCTHYPLVEPLFRRHLAPSTRLLSQPEVVADSLEDYLHRHPRFVSEAADRIRSPVLLTSGDPVRVARTARIFWQDVPAFAHLVHRIFAVSTAMGRRLRRSITSGSTGAEGASIAPGTRPRCG